MDPIWIIVIVAAVLVPVLVHRLTSGKKADNASSPQSSAPHYAGMWQSETKGSLEAQIKTLLASGDKIEAIKHFRTATGQGLAEAKAAVEKVETGALFDHSWGATPAGPSSSEVEASARALVREGKTIEAIKLVRDRTALGLKEAKEYVERLK